jgi:hypothetical protein
MTDSIVSNKTVKRHLIPTIVFWIISLTILSIVGFFWISPFKGSSYDSPQRRRAGCVMNIRNTQQSVRSYANLKNVAIGSVVTIEDLNKLNGFPSKDLKCPEGYVYEWNEVVPEVGQLYLRCTNPKHLNFDYSDW